MAESSSKRVNSRLRLVDRYFGIPLVFLLGLRPKRKRLPAFSTLGLLQTAAIGDTVLMSGLLRDLRRSFPAARIIFFAGPSNYQMAKLLEGPDEVVKLPVDNPLRAVRSLRGKSLDVLCDFGPWPRFNAVCAALSGARFLTGFDTAGEYRHYAYDRAVEHSSRVHELENQRALVESLGVESKSLPTLNVTAPLPRELESRNYLVFHGWSAGYRGYLKEWPEEYWAKLAEGVGPLGYPVVLTGGPGDRPASEALRARIEPALGRPVVNLAGQTSLAETIRVLRDAVAVVSVNTSIVHLAAAVSTPVLSINGPVAGARWGPVGPNSVSLEADGPDCGFLNLGFEYQGHREDCMASIQPERVLQALMHLLASREPLEPSRSVHGHE